MVYGYMGKICIVDLANGEIKEEKLSDEIFRNFIGGEGLGAKILYEGQKAKVDALGPENILGFVTGLLTGCNVPAASRCTVVTKSPLTGGWGDSNVGGSFGPALKACGYDAIFFKGMASNPVYLLLDDENVEVRDAIKIWGKDTNETLEILTRETGDPDIKVACIGPSGETLSLISGIIAEGRAAARSGVGAVMGSKHLKAIAVRGKKRTQLADPEAIKKMRENFIQDLKKTHYFVIETLRKFGTCGLVSLGVQLGIAPIKNWSLNGEEAFPSHSKLNGENVTKFQIKKTGCPGCPIVCGGIVRIDKGLNKAAKTRKPEYETLISFGSMCLNDDVMSIIKANNICDCYGLDTISAGATIAFAIECYEQGVINKNDTDGIELTWGNVSAILSMLAKMAKREGFGAVLADGVKKAAEQIGQGSEEIAIHIQGQEIPYHDFRYEEPGRGTVYISDPTPSRHERFTGMQMLERRIPLGPYPEFQAKAIEILDYQNKGEIYSRGAKYYEVFVSCGMCAFTMGVSSTFPLVDVISAATGWDFTPSEMLIAGERIQTLRQAFNIREGLRPQDFYIPKRLKKPSDFGLLKGVSVDYNRLREVYYKSMNWDPETGRPSKQRWQELGLGE